ncbi:hypothetical protein JHK82_018521 [Glycine max]|uniref:LRR receptor-like serine/threonine-protein kinase GSO1 n=1 Tax=Glycine soja TaxID=3848 RepID=A0A0B2PBR7_GLYSO|nr:hypothetical protein JHK85_018952 [Glycine max]KAG5037710.1 hypothetical protein JHK86_018550 [Glycine max]KAG5142826.1 hypothetical protein JHK82_018521 [Glycine max]KHN05128.1 LRR receptor-like serine/threonine-protein kinase GSO1 [Glycine soja]
MVRIGRSAPINILSCLLSTKTRQCIECDNQSGHILKLDLQQANASWVRDVSWLSTLSSLQYLSLNFVKVTSTADELFQTVIRMPSLLELYLMSCDLDTLPPSLPFKIITSPLSGLDLSGNPFKRSSIPSWLFNMSNLTYISLSLSSLRGPLPLFRRGNLCKLQNLDLSDNDLTGGVTQMLDTLSFCSNQSLEYLDLSSNHLTGK